MNRCTLILSLLLLLVSSAFSQEKFTLSGYVKDAESGESMIGAIVAIGGQSGGFSTNVYGFYSMTLEKGTYKVSYSYYGYATHVKEVVLDKDVRLDVELAFETSDLDEVVVKDKAGNQQENTQMGTIKLEMEEMKTLPAFMGEVDVIKSIQLLPGVSSVGEGAQGFYVRGGGPDQNLVLLDGVPVYNASHLFGFFSVFNADAVRNLNLIKGGMPARYGGRMASVLEVNMKEGNMKRFGVTGGLGLLASRLTVEGPFKKDVGSFIVSGRSTYVHLLMKPLIKKDSPFRGSQYYFYDMNAKMNFNLGKNDRIFASGYFGRDVFDYKNSEAEFDVSIPWGNIMATLRWNHVFNSKLFMNLTGLFTDYEFRFESEQDDFAFSMLSGVRDAGARLDFNYYPNPRHDIRFGADYTYHVFTPTSVSARSDTIDIFTGEKKTINAHEAGIYLEDDFDVTDWLRLNVGLRYSLYQQVGPFTRFYPSTVGSQDSVVEYARGEPIQFNNGLEPRVSFRIKTGRSSSIKLGYNQNYQYVHLAPLSAVSLPTDIWFPVTERAKPQRGWQVALGYFQNIGKDMFDASVEVYYKRMDNLIEYAEGALPEDNVNDNVDNLLVFGRGWGYGAEFYIKKKRGKFTGWIGYTLSWSWRQFDDIDQGNKFPAKYDRRHDLSVVAQYKINESWTLGTAFVFATGNAITLPVARYIYEGEIVNEYGPRNSHRMADYHRLDLSATWFQKNYRYKTDPVTGEKEKIKRRFQNSINISIYNVYNRANPYFIYFDNEGDYLQGTLDITAKQVSLFPILPSVTWNFKW